MSVLFAWKCYCSRLFLKYDKRHLKKLYAQHSRDVRVAYLAVAHNQYAFCELNVTILKLSVGPQEYILLQPPHHPPQKIHSFQSSHAVKRGKSPAISWNGGSAQKVLLIFVLILGCTNHRNIYSTKPPEFLNIWKQCNSRRKVDRHMLWNSYRAEVDSCLYLGKFLSSHMC